MVLLHLMNYRFLPTFYCLFFVRVIEELRPVEGLLLGTDEVLKV